MQLRVRLDVSHRAGGGTGCDTDRYHFHVLFVAVRSYWHRKAVVR